MTCRMFTPVELGARIEKDLERVANWIGMKMNVAKTQLMGTYQKR